MGTLTSEEIAAKIVEVLRDMPKAMNVYLSQDMRRVHFDYETPHPSGDGSKWLHLYAHGAKGIAAMMWSPHFAATIEIEAAFRKAGI